MSVELLNRACSEIGELRLLFSAEALARAAGDAKFRASLRSKADNALSAVNQSDGSIEAFDYIEYTDDAYYRLLSVAMVLKHLSVPSDDYDQIKMQLDMAANDISEALKIAGEKIRRPLLKGWPSCFWLKLPEQVYYENDKYYREERAEYCGLEPVN